MLLRKIVSKKNRALVGELVRTDFKLRYQGSILGYAWSLLRPLLIFVILYVVFVKFLRLGTGIPHYPVYLLFGIVTWNFFGEVTQQSLGSIVTRGDLIRKIRIPRWTIVLSSSFSAVINLLLNLLVIAIFMAISHVEPTTTTIWVLPVFIEIYLFALGMAFLLAAAFVKFRDLSYIWEVLLQAGFYVTPVIYPLSRITNATYQKLLLINPMGQAMQDARYAAITHQTLTARQLSHDMWYLMIPFMIVAVALVAGVVYFRKEAQYFAENI